MKYVWGYIPLLIWLVVMVYMISRSEEKRETFDYHQTISVISSEDIKYFLSEDGYWINHRMVKGFKVIEPWPGKYSVQVYIPWSSHCVRSGFQNRKDAENWLVDFLRS